MDPMYLILVLKSVIIWKSVVILPSPFYTVSIPQSIKLNKLRKFKTVLVCHI